MGIILINKNGFKNEIWDYVHRVMMKIKFISQTAIHR